MIPVLFVSHGAPDILLSQNESNAALRNLSKQVSVPKAIVMISAHWTAASVGITNSENLNTIHDFGGFQPELYQLQYPARGDAALSHKIASLFQEKGVDAQLNQNRGLDHGAWIPLMLMYPQADIPVVQVSLPTGSLDQLVKFGEALKPLREEDVLIIGSGGTVHNLRELSHFDRPDEWVIKFEEWLRKTVEENRFDDLINVEKFPTDFHRAHPTIEHYLPIIAAWSAGDRKMPGRRLHQSFSYGNLGMSHYLFE